MFRSKMLAVLALGAILMVSGIGHAAHSETRKYVTGANAGLDLNGTVTPPPAAIGGGRFLNITPDETVVAITTADQVSADAAFTADFRDAANKSLGTANFCGTATLDLPDGTTSMWVTGNAEGAVKDGLCAMSVPTAGTITVSFS